MRNTMLLLNSLWLSGLTACQPKPVASLSEYPVVNICLVLQEEAPIPMKEDMGSIEYVPLKMTDSCLISNLMNLQVTVGYMFMYSGKTEEVLQFNREGKSIRKTDCQGNGPGEYDMINDLTVDDRNRELSLFQYGGDALVHLYDGTFLRNGTIVKQAGGTYVFPDGKRTLKGLVTKPFQQTPWAGVLQQPNGSLQECKALSPSGLSRDVCFMKGIYLSPLDERVLVLTACNDIVSATFNNGIEPAYMLKRGNSVEYYMDIANINKFGDETIETDQVIGFYDLFESSYYLYLRLYEGDMLFIQWFDKKTGELKSQCIPKGYLEYNSSIPDDNITSIDNDIDGGTPLWPEYAQADGERTQVVNADILSSLREKGYLKEAPTALNVADGANPIVIFYRFKKQEVL